MERGEFVGQIHRGSEELRDWVQMQKYTTACSCQRRTALIRNIGNLPREVQVHLHFQITFKVVSKRGFRGGNYGQPRGDYPFGD